MAFNTLSFSDRNYPSAARRGKRTNVDLLLGFLVAAILMFKVATADAADTQAPSIPAGVTAMPISATQIRLTWNASTDNVGVMGYYIYANGSNVGPTTSTTYVHSGLKPGITYRYTLRAYDAKYNYSALSASVAATTPTAGGTTSPSPDTQAPSVPTGLTGTALSANEIRLNWNASTDNVGVTGYYVYVNNVALGTTTSTSYTHSGLIAGTSYNYRVSAFDAIPNHSTWTVTPVAVTTAVTTIGGADTQAPSIPAGLTATPVSATEIRLTWNASTDNVGVMGYYIYANGSNVGPTNSTTYVHSGLQPGITYRYTLRAYDAKPNFSALTASVAATTPLAAGPDTAAPSVPTGLAGTALSANQIRLTWSAATDNVGVTGYHVYLNDIALGTTTGTTYTHSGLTAGTIYRYRVSAFDAISNNSAWTATPVAVTTPAALDTTAPSVPTGLAGTALSSNQIRLTWNAATDNVGVTGYHVYLNGVSLGTTTSTTYTLSGLAAGTTYNYRVSAYDAVPNHSAWTATVAVTTPAASTPPPPPIGYLPVVPGLAGYGTQTRAGRGGTVYKVTNLNTSGAGSLRACTEASGPRVCVFEVSGNINLGGGVLNVSSPFITIAGQTAPAPGVSIINGSFNIITHDVLVQHIRVRGGLAPERRTPLSVDNNTATTYNVVIDHVSMAWSTDDLVLTWWGAHDVTWSHVLATGELNNPGVYSDAVGKVMITDSADYNILMRDSALLTGYQRMPLAQANPFVFVNNVVYNWGGVATQFMRQRVSSGGEFVLVNNHYRTGPLHSQAWVQKPIFVRDELVPGIKIYLNGNHAPDFTASQQWDLVDNRSPFTQAQMQVSTLGAWPTGLVPKNAADGSLFETVLNNAGAFPLSRDSLDARLVSDARNRTGGYLTSTTFPTVAQNVRALTLPTNPNGDDNNNGYTNLEEWLHCMAAQVEGRACQ